MSTDSRKTFEIGYQRPPRANQFKKGSSGNPKGRPKGAQNLSTIAQKELALRVPVIENGRKTTLTKGAILVKAHIAKAAKGDARSAEWISKLDQRAEATTARPNLASPLAEEDSKIIENYIAARQSHAGEQQDDNS